MAELTINRRQYRVLLEMVNLATYVTQYHNRSGREDWLNAVEDLAEKILRKADAMGCGDLVEPHPETGQLVPAEDYEQESFYKECLDDMLEHCFWEDLVSRLSDRDLARQMGPDQWDKLSDQEKARRREQRDRHYWAEFEARGIDGLELIAREPHG